MEVQVQVLVRCAECQKAVGMMSFGSLPSCFFCLDCSKEVFAETPSVSLMGTK